MILYYVVCEYDVGLNLDGRSGCYSSQDKVDEVLDLIDWSEMTEENDYQELIDEDLLFIEIING